MLAMIIFVLGLFKFPVTVNPFSRFPSYTNFIFATVSYHSSPSCCCCSLAAVGPCCCSSSSLAAPDSCFCSSSAYFSMMYFNFFSPYSIFSTILLYNKEEVSRTLYSLSASASRVAATGADTALYNFEIIFLKNVFTFYYMFLINFLKILWTG